MRDHIGFLAAVTATALTSLVFVFGCLAASGSIINDAQGQIYYVAPGGDDDNPGTLDKPWATVQKAAESLAPGDTVYVREGVYNEMVFIEVSGSENGGYIHFLNFPGEQPVLDGTGLSTPDGVNGIYIADQSYVILEGFEIRNYQSAIPNNVPIGIQIEGASHHIQILNNYIHHIETHAPVDGDLMGADAHGLVVYGTHESQPIQHLTIDGNLLSDLVLGSSEAMALNGNVAFFTITQNIVHDVDNIGIGLIGFEGMVADRALDRAREGVVQGNTIHHVDSASNPAYGGEQSAGGIYVDGGRDILIERNRVYVANIGIEIASEHADGSATNITARNNLVYNNHIAGIAIGGYDMQRGYADNCTIVNNTFYNNDTTHSGNGELMVQYDTRHNLIKNNIFYANQQGILISNPFTNNNGNQIDYNLYYATAGETSSQWTWKNVTHTSFEAYRDATGNDLNGFFSDPKFANLETPDLHLEAGSPAINAGSLVEGGGEGDFDGDVRVQGPAVDIGADEWTVKLFLVMISNQVSKE